MLHNKVSDFFVITQGLEARSWVHDEPMRSEHNPVYFEIPSKESVLFTGDRKQPRTPPPRPTMWQQTQELRAYIDDEMREASSAQKVQHSMPWNVQCNGWGRTSMQGGTLQ